MMDNKYENGKIYKITSGKTKTIYIGSTIEPLKIRLQKHKSKYTMYQNKRHHYVSSFDILKYDDHKIELLEEYPCETKTQLHKKEGEYIKKFKDICVNPRIAGRTQKEYRDSPEHKAKQKEYMKVWREENKDKVKQKNKQKYASLDKDEKKKIDKDYYESNKGKVKERVRRYYEEVASVKITCDCGKEILKASRARHMKSKQHINFMNSD